MTDAFSFVLLTVDTARRALTIRLRAHGIDSAELDARMLVGAVLGLDLTGLISAARRVLNDAEATRLERYASRRIAGEPVARIVGIKEFWGLPLQLSAATLVPRPDTETVVELALQILRGEPARGRALRIADLGTGSGAILLALLSEIPNASGVGTDISIAALSAARANARQLGFAERTAFVACNYASALSGTFDLVTSNPPYIRSTEIADLAAEVRDHDPHLALDGGTDGLDAYRCLIPMASGLLSSGGALVLEVGLGQSAAVEALISRAGLIPCQSPKADLTGIARAVAGRKLSR